MVKMTVLGRAMSISVLNSILLLVVTFFSRSTTNILGRTEPSQVHKVHGSLLTACINLAGHIIHNAAQESVQKSSASCLVPFPTVGVVKLSEPILVFMPLSCNDCFSTVCWNQYDKTIESVCDNNCCVVALIDWLVICVVERCQAWLMSPSCFLQSLGKPQICS